MRDIRLSNGMVAMVDDEDYDILIKYRWHYRVYKSKNKNTGYAMAWIRHDDGKKRWVFMHRMVLGLRREDNIIVDHKDDDTLHNYKSNLRKCTIGQNNMARNILRDNKQSKYKGVCRTRNKRRWRATISCNDKTVYIGTFDNEEDAALAYNIKAMELYGEFAYLNEVRIDE